MSKTTIYQVAEEAGVSTATVSKVLSEQPYVADATRARVREAVEKLQYVPNVAAQGLAGARTHIIGVVISYEPRYLFSDPHLLQILHGATDAAAEKNCAVLLSTARSGDDRLSAFRRLLGQQYIDGALVEGSLGEVGFSLLKKRGYPVVAVGYSEEVSCVHTDDRSGAYQMTDHLLALGHRRIGVINGPPSDRLAMETRLAGYREALEAAGLPFDEQLIAYGTFTSNSGYEKVQPLLALERPPTAIFAFNDRMAMGAIRWLHEHGYRVPEDISVVGFDDIPAAEAFDPPLTTVRQLSAEQGRRAAALLFDQIKQRNIPNKRREIPLPAELIVRRSATPPEERPTG